MKKLLFVISFVFLLMPFSVDAKEVNFYLFYGDGCPHCQALKEYLNKEYADDKDVNLYKYEVWNSSNDKNRELWQKVQDVTEVYARGVPYFVIGDEVFQGYSEGKTWEAKVDKAIKKAKRSNYHDNTGIVLGVVDGEIKKKEESTSSYDPDKKEVDRSEYLEKENAKEDETYAMIDIPVIGTVDLRDTAIPLVAILMGLVDGFNPCAMWILLFLITMLFDYPSRKKMWILGCTFLFTSAFIYFLFMISFLNIAMFMNSITILKLFISFVALGFGIFNIYRFIKTKDAGCDVVNKDKRKKIMIRIKNILNEKKFILSLFGIIILAISVNLIELLCSLGLPVMFTEILAYNNITGYKNIIYILIYVLFFLMDDLIIFFLAMKTLKINAVSNKYTKYSHLIGGVIMILIGLLMLFKPEWLMFNF